MSSIGVLKVPLNSPSQPKDDLRSRRILLKRQQLQEEFTKRILDPKIRTIGIDKQALDAQVKEKQIVTQMEKDRDAYFERQMVDMDAHAQYLQRESDHLRHKREVDLNKYRECFQRKEHCREWDLQDPKRILNELPARIRDDDIRCGPSSIQKFEGEDLDAKCRRRAQNLQQQHWAEEQVSERRMRDLIHKEYDVAMDRCAEEMTNRAFEIQNVVAQQRRAAAITTTNFNLALAKQKEDEKKRQKLQETISSIEEVQNMLDSDFLAETQGIREKGLSETDKQYIHREQQRQREDVYQRKLREAEERKQEDLRLEMERRMAVALDRQRERERKAALIQLAEERKEQARNKLEADKNLKMTYTPTVTEGFFDRFGLGRKF